jgi:hypothetical protein
MANLGCTDSPRPRRTGALGTWLLVLAGVCATIWYSNLNQEGPAVQGRPFAQTGQDD